MRTNEVSKDELSDQELDGISAGFCGFSLPAGGTKGIFEVEDFSFDIEQTLSIGS